MVASDEEKGQASPQSSTLIYQDKDLHHASDTADLSGESSPSVIYNGTGIKQDNGILSKLRYFEARMDAKLGIESDAIERKRPEDKRPVKWHEELTMALLWASGTVRRFPLQF